MTVVIAKNNDSVDILIEDMGTEILVSEQETLTDNYSFVDICASKDLKNYVQNSNIVINDGSSDLNAADGLKHISLQSEYEDSADETGGAGQPTQAFDAYDGAGGLNLTTTPQDITLTVERKKTSGFTFTAPSAEVEFTVNDTMVVFGKLGERPVSTAGATRGNAVVKFQLDTGSGYVDVPGFSWEYNREGAYGGTPVMFAIIDVSVGDKLKMQGYLSNGTPDIDTVANASSLTIFSLKGPKGDQGDPGSGGGWDVGATPPSSPSDGDGWYNTGDKILYIYDGGRSKWLSAESFIVTLNHYLGADDEYLRSGEVRDDSVAGASFHRATTLIGMSVRASSGNSNKGCSLEIDYSNLNDFYVVNYKYDADNYDFDLDVGEVMMFYVWPDGSPLRNTIAHLEFKWRYAP